jgi:hypothetical protein
MPSPIYAYFNATLDLSLDTTNASLIAGAANEDELFVYFLNKSHVDYPTATITFKRSDGTISPELVMDQTSFVYSGTAFPTGTYANSYKFLFYDDWILALKGPLEATVRLYGVNGNVLVSGKLTVNVEASVFSPETTITPTQYTNLVNQINSLATNDNAVKIILPNCRNDDTVQLTVGMPVYASGSIGASGKIKIKRASANYTIPQSNKLFGVVIETINVGSDGGVMILGEVTGVNTATLIEGEPVFVSTTPGQLTSTAPTAPNHRIVVGGVIRAANNGIVYVKQQIGLDVAELCDVQITSVQNGNTLRYNSSTLRWENTNALTTAEANITNLQGRMTTEEGNVDNLQGRMTTAESDIDQVENNKVDKTTTIAGVDLQNNITLEEFKTALGNATTSLAGLMSATDKTNLDNLVTILGTADADDIVNTITEILAIFNNYPEGADLVTALNGKVDKIAGKGLSTNDLTNTLKTNYDTAYNHSQIVTGNPHGTTIGDIGAEPANANIQAHVTLTDGTNPHATTFANIQTKPTTIGGYGITDAYTKTQIDTSLSGKADIVDGKIPANQLPSFVDDVLEVYERAGATPTASDWFSLTSGGVAITPEAGKIYVIIAGALVNKTYRWSGTQYSIIGEMALGTTAATAFFGDRGLATETQSNNIVSGVQGLTDTRITNSDVGVSPLIVNGVASTTADLQRWNVNGVKKSFIDVNGNLGVESVYNPVNFNVAYTRYTATGTEIIRNVADSNPSLIVNQQNASSTGDILRLQSAGVNKLEVNKDGWLFQNGNRLFIQPVSNENTFFGTLSGRIQSTGDGNTAFGRSALSSLSSGNANVAVGLGSLLTLTTGSQNTIVGTYAGNLFNGDSNSFFGYNSGGSITSGATNTFLGHTAGTNALQAPNASNSTAIGHQAYTNTSNQMVFGNASVTEFKFNRNTGATVLLPIVSSSTHTIIGSDSGNTTFSSYKNGATNVALLGHDAAIFGLSNGFGIYVYGNNPLDFSTNASKRMTITGVGNVGIGTTSPLDLTGAGYRTLAISGTSTGALVDLMVGSTRLGALYADINSTAVGSLTNIPLLFTTNDTERMRILANGNVGIGTNNPANKLRVKGTMVSESPSNATKFAWFEYNDTVDGLSIQALHDGVDFKNTILSALGGNVGIGTTAPSERLHVAGNARIEGNLTVNGSVTQVNTNVANTERLTITNDGTGPAIIANQTGAQPVVDFQDDGVSAFYIADGGKIGIGTTSPSATSKLTIRDASIANIRTENTVGGFVEFGISENANSVGFIKSNYFLDFIANNATRMFIEGGNGNVGIGTISPARILEILSATNAQSYLRISGASGNAADTNFAGIEFFNNDGSQAGPNVASFIEARAIDTTGAGGHLVFGTSVAEASEGARATEKMRILGNGNVGIGTTNPTQKLQVDGNINASVSSGSVSISLFTPTASQTSLDISSFGKAYRIINNTSSLSFFDASAQISRMGITTDGLVGINENTISAQLQVKSGATTRVPLIVDSPTSQTADLQQWKVNGVSKSYINAAGNFFGDGIVNIDGVTNAYINTATAGTNISRNIADTNPALIVNLANAGATEDIIKFQWQGTTQASVARDGIANFAGTPSNAQTGDYTLVLADKGKVLRINSDSARIVTIPLNSSVAFPIDTEIAILRYGTGTVDIAATAGVNLYSKNSEKAISGQYGSVALKKIATDDWVLVGSLEA